MTKFLKSIVVAAVIVSGAVGFTSCGDEITEQRITQNYYGALSHREFFTVKVSDWSWNDVTERYEVFFDVPSLNQHIYDSGAVIGAIFVDPKGTTETQHSLPFVHTYRDGDVYKYTETISFDATPGSIGFYIQASDLDQADYALANYEFKITMFWEKEK